MQFKLKNSLKQKYVVAKYVAMSYSAQIPIQKTLTRKKLKSTSLNLTYYYHT